MTDDSRQGATVHLTNLTKTFAGVKQPAVDNIDLKVGPGEFLTLLGPSGSGKTTTLNMIAGFETVTAGSILIDDVDYAGVAAHKRDIGMVFQHYALFPHMTAAENVAYPLKQRKVPKAKIAQQVVEALDMVRLGEYAGRYPSELSGGQQQRIAVARAIVYRPRVLLMDEPLGALDKTLRDQLQIEMKRLHRELGLTFILVTHDQEEALSMSDRIAVFNEGAIEQVGTPEELYERPATQFVAEFMGASTLLTGQLDTKASTLRSDHFEVAVPAGEHGPGPHALAIRPERITVLGDDQKPLAGHNVLQAVVHEIVYLGVVRRLMLTFPWGGSGMVRETVVGSSNTTPGDTVRVAWPTDAGVVVRATTSNT